MPRLGLRKLKQQKLQAISDEVESIARAILKPGVYRDPKDINPLFQKMFEHYEGRFLEYAKRLPTTEFLAFFMRRYEEVLGKYYRTGKVDDLPFSDAPSTQKALMFALERAVLFANGNAKKISRRELMVSLNAAYLCATRMAEFAVSSDQIHGVYKNHTEVQIFDGRNDKGNFMQMKIDPDIFKAVNDLQDAKKNNKERMALFGEDAPAELDVRKKYLDPHMKGELGFSFEEARSVANAFIQKKPFILPEHMMIDSIAKHVRLDVAIVRKIVSGFSITKEQLEGRETPIWKMHLQNNRIAYRPLLVADLYKEGLHIGFAPVLVQDVLNYFNGSLIYKYWPAEWETPKLKTQIEYLSNEVSSWFELKSKEVLHARGFVGENYSTSIGVRKNIIPIPKVGVGELDFLGYHPKLKLLLLVELKLTRWGSDPRDYYDDYRQFVDNPDPKEVTYKMQVDRKANWIQQNFKSVLDAVTDQFRLPRSSGKIRFARCIATYHPTVASVFIQDFPCCTIVELCKNLDSCSDWGFKSGISEISI